MTEAHGPSIEEIRLASRRLSQHLLRTPLITNPTLDDLIGCSAFWKLESLQHTNAFKVRGALNFILSLPQEQRVRGVVTASSGNHGIGTAYAAHQAQVPATIVVPTSAPAVKRQRCEMFGATVHQFGRTYNDALECASQHALARGSILISTFEDPIVIAGQATVVLEILEELENLEAVVVPIGGGSLAAGAATVIKTLRPSVALYGVQTRAASSCHASRLAGEPVRSALSETIADGIVCEKPGALCLSIMRDVVNDILLVDEASIAPAVWTLLRELRVVAEPAAAVCLSALLSYRDIFRGKRVACVLTGGNIDDELLRGIVLGESRGTRVTL